MPPRRQPVRLGKLYLYVADVSLHERAFWDYRSPTQQHAPSGMNGVVVHDAVIGVKSRSLIVPVRYWVPVSMLNRAIRTWALIYQAIRKDLEDEKGHDETAASTGLMKIARDHINYHIQCREQILEESEKIAVGEGLKPETSLPTLNEWVFRQVKVVHCGVRVPDCPQSILSANSETLQSAVKEHFRKGMLTH